MRRPPSRQQQIVAELRQKILNGELRPGARLPTRTELEERFGVATQTMQRCIAHLMRDGFVIARGKLGTFVAKHPPHLYHYGLVLAHDPSDPETWERTKFSTFLYREAVACRKRGERNISTYVSVNGHVDTEDYQRLLDHVGAHRVAGLVFDVPTYLDKPPLAELLDVPGLPCVAIGSGSHHPNLFIVSPPREMVINRALDYLKSAGHRGVGLLASAYEEKLFHDFAQGVCERGMTTRTYWLQGVSPYTARSARNCAHLLMQAKERPDALVISDDSLVEHATSGLLDAAVRVPHDVEVVAQCNFPYTTPSAVPARRIGFDIRAVLRTALEVIDRRRRGGPVSAVTTVPPIFDDEFKAKVTDAGMPGAMTATVR